MPQTNIYPDPQPISRGIQFALFLTALAWVGAANSLANSAAQGISTRLDLPAEYGLLQALFLLFLVIVGFRALDLIATRGAQAADIMPLPKRPTRWAEFATGGAIGWGLAVAIMLPLLLTLHLHTAMAWPAGTTSGILISLATLLALALGEEVIFRGYPFQRLSQAFGQGTAALVMSLGFAITVVAFNSSGRPGMAFFAATCLGILLALCYMRTHALWLGWGLHFAYRAAVAVLFGLPVAERGNFTSAAQTVAAGPRWLSGGVFGPDGAFLTALILLGAIPVVYHFTRDWAWTYTHREITGAGYAVEVAPPAAHTAMENARPAAPPPLVQILPTTPQTFSRQDG